MLRVVIAIVSDARNDGPSCAFIAQARSKVTVSYWDTWCSFLFEYASGYVLLIFDSLLGSVAVPRGLALPYLGLGSTALMGLAGVPLAGLMGSGQY